MSGTSGEGPRSVGETLVWRMVDHSDMYDQEKKSVTPGGLELTLSKLNDTHCMLPTRYPTDVD